jgi:hypothetical protein
VQSFIHSAYCDTMVEVLMKIVQNPTSKETKMVRDDESGLRLASEHLCTQWIHSFGHTMDLLQCL